MIGSIVSKEKKPPVRMLLSFAWLVLVGAVLGCLVSKAGDPPDGSPLYYLGVRPLASLAPLLGAIWLSSVLAPHWGHVSRAHKLSLLIAFIASATLCAWVFYTVWHMRA